MEKDVERLFLTVNFSRNPAHRERLRQALLAADDGELSEDMLEQAAGGLQAPPPDRKGLTLWESLTQ